MPEIDVFQREFSFSETDFRFIQDKIFQLSGISLSDGKKQMVYGRLARRLRFLGLQAFKDYCQLLNDDNAEETDHFINALTTNKTSFFREKHHFDYLADTIIPQLAKMNAQKKRVRIWCSACSTGEEPYTIAMVLNRSKIAVSGWDTKVLASDLDSNVLDTAKQGIYDERSLEDIEQNFRHGNFLKGGKSHPNKIMVTDKLRELITFKQLNLMEAWPIKGPFDVIFCRNVVIYFDKKVQQELFQRFYDLLSDDGYLIIGHSESLGPMAQKFKMMGRTIYRKY